MSASLKIGNSELQLKAEDSIAWSLKNLPAINDYGLNITVYAVNGFGQKDELFRMKVNYLPNGSLEVASMASHLLFKGITDMDGKVFSDVNAAKLVALEKVMAIPESALVDYLE